MLKVRRFEGCGFQNPLAHFSLTRPPGAWGGCAAGRASGLRHLEGRLDVPQRVLGVEEVRLEAEGFFQQDARPGDIGEAIRYALWGQEGMALPPAGRRPPPGAGAGPGEGSPHGDALLPQKWGSKRWVSRWNPL